MPISKKDLKKLKKDLKDNNPSFLNRPKPKKVKKIVKQNTEPIKKLIKYNYKVGDIIYLNTGLYINETSYNKGELGLIISSKMYFGKKVQQNGFFILINSSVINVNGKHIRLTK